MPVQLVQRRQPVTGFNYGAKLYDRVRQSIRFSVTGTVLYAAAFWAIAMLFPGFLLRIFSNEPDVIEQAFLPCASTSACLFPCRCKWRARACLSAWAGPSRQYFSPCCATAIINAPLTVILPIWMYHRRIHRRGHLPAGRRPGLQPHHVFHRLPPAGQPAGPAPGSGV